MMAKSTPPWGKTSVFPDTHHLAHHCADVAACFEALANIPVIRNRLTTAARQSISPTVLSRLAVFVFLHDAGKLHPGFQAKGWPHGVWHKALHGHVGEGGALFSTLRPKQPILAQKLLFEEWQHWCNGPDALLAVLAHHGRPIQLPGEPHTEQSWESVKTPGWTYDPVIAADELGTAMRNWFAPAFASCSDHLPVDSGFWHLFCGLVTLADWIGSDAKRFPYVSVLDSAYIAHARALARRAVTLIGLDTATLKPTGTDFSAVAPFLPNQQQQLVGTIPPDEQLIVLEAETGSGKTEAALWRFVQLFTAERVDSLYFALPTRAAAKQLHTRVNVALKRMFSDTAPEAVLAVPGYLKIGEAGGQALPDWKVRWDDTPDETRLAARWAGESSKRFLAATIAVGTVDQVLLAGLKVKHAHMRAAALSRTFLIVDEVHASDHYMTGILDRVLQNHLGWGGYAMLMSATLGATARAKWLHQPAPDLAAAVAAPYPAVWCNTALTPASVTTAGNQKSVTMAICPTMAADETARQAIEAAKAGARVLVIRNTVAVAINTWQAVQNAEGTNLLWQVAGGPALHHSRFAREDRERLDMAVEVALSPRMRDVGGVIVIGTQTLEQSLDIDADILLTDLCPIDVLLQRIGRLHRHRLHRPRGYEAPRCVVMVPETGLARLLAPPTFENGLGGWVNNGTLCGIYRDLSCLELTRRLIEAEPIWTIPTMNRFLVERATHPTSIDALHTELGDAWNTYHNQVYGADIAKMGAARAVALDVREPFADMQFPGDEEAIRTRLGGEGARISFTEPITSPFGEQITTITLPAHWPLGPEAATSVTPAIGTGGITFRVGTTTFRYTRAGLDRGKA